MKYIKFKHRGFVVFEDTQEHKEIANIIGDEVESAGQVQLGIDRYENPEVICFGESISLGVSANVEGETCDSNMLSLWMNGGY